MASQHTPGAAHKPVHSPVKDAGILPIRHILSRVSKYEENAPSYRRKNMNCLLRTAGVALIALSASAGLQAQTASGPTDTHIAGIVVAANQIDIDAGKLALKKTKNSEVRQLAQQI